MLDCGKGQSAKKENEIHKEFVRLSTPYGHKSKESTAPNGFSTR